ncbi:hypothetical protein [Streptomyces sp. NPDC058657]|uniref:hypothetical protein n=1 Tax=unclassified Streptomyces TaxID=2593676 RepID=UPI003652C76F
MDLTAGTKATAVAAAAVVAGGVAVILYGIARDELSRSLGGACLTMTALTLIALIAIRRWTTNTDAERASLAAATREADTERMRSVANQASLEAERQRLLRDAASERARLAAAMDVERAAMRAQFEEEKNRLVCETFEAAYNLFKESGGEFAPCPDHAKVIGLFGTAAPKRAPVPAPSPSAPEPSPTHERGATRG